MLTKTMETFAETISKASNFSGTNIQYKQIADQLLNLLFCTSKCPILAPFKNKAFLCGKKIVSADELTNPFINLKGTFGRSYDFLHCNFKGRGDVGHCLLCLARPAVTKS